MARLRTGLLLILILAALPARAERPLNGAEFEAYTKGRTLYFSSFAAVSSENMTGPPQGSHSRETAFVGGRALADIGAVGSSRGLACREASCCNLP